MVKGKNLTFTTPPKFNVKIITMRNIPLHLFCSPVTFYKGWRGVLFPISVLRDPYNYFKDSFFYF